MGDMVTDRGKQRTYVIVRRPSLQPGSNITSAPFGRISSTEQHKTKFALSNRWEPKAALGGGFQTPRARSWARDGERAARLRHSDTVSQDVTDWQGPRTCQSHG